LFFASFARSASMRRVPSSRKASRVSWINWTTGPQKTRRSCGRC
jgi:hypothetical protein